MKLGFGLFGAAAGVYTFFASSVHLSAERKEMIEKKRGNLKPQESDSSAVSEVVSGLLTYKTTAVTLDDRFLQLERVLDAIDKARQTRKDGEMIETICTQVQGELNNNPDFLSGVAPNKFQVCVSEICSKIKPGSRH